MLKRPFDFYLIAEFSEIIRRNMQRKLFTGSFVCQRLALAIVFDEFFIKFAKAKTEFGLYKFLNLSFTYKFIHCLKTQRFTHLLKFKMFYTYFFKNFK